MPDDQDTQIARLADDFSRLQHRDSQEAGARPPSAHGHGDGGQNSQGTPVAAEGTEANHDDEGSDAATDESPSADLDADTLEESPLEQKRSEMIERIMKSFRATLDSKIAAIGGRAARPKAKKEAGVELPEERLEQPRSKQALTKERIPAGKDQPRTGSSAPDAAGTPPHAPQRSQPPTPGPVSEPSGLPTLPPSLPVAPLHIGFPHITTVLVPAPPPQPSPSIARGAGLPGRCWPTTPPRPSSVKADHLLTPPGQVGSARVPPASGSWGVPVRSSPNVGSSEGFSSPVTSIRNFSPTVLRPETVTEVFSSGQAPQPAVTAPEFHGSPFVGSLAPSASAAQVPPTERQQNDERGQRRASYNTKRAASPDVLSPESLLEADEGEDGDGRRKKSKRSPNAAGTGGRGSPKFACPYFKRNPKKYRKWTSCPGPGWDEVHRVKTHLYRRHTLPLQCPRCREPFKEEDKLQAHLQQDPPCPIRQSRTIQEGFTKEQEKKLRSRKKTHADMTDEDKWREIYMILFPDDDPDTIPSPYYSEAEDGGDNHNSGFSGELEDYATFIRREMPTLVRRELERLFQEEYPDIEERIRPRVADIVLSLQPRLLNLYRQSQMPLSEYGPQQHADLGGTASVSEANLTPLLSQGTDLGSVSDLHSCPDTMAGAGRMTVEDFEAQFGYAAGGLGIQWSALDPMSSHMMPAQPLEGGAGLSYCPDWEQDFEKLLNPALFMPPGGGNYAAALSVRAK
ncbi:hypothetical protein VTH06DRAFT_4196 [Thermothelomyces fergusii]